MYVLVFGSLMAAFTVIDVAWLPCFIVGHTRPKYNSIREGSARICLVTRFNRAEAQERKGITARGTPCPARAAWSHPISQLQLGEAQEEVGFSAHDLLLL